MEALTKINIDHKKHFDEASKYVEEEIKSSGINLNVHNWDYIEQSIQLANQIVQQEELEQEDIYVVKFTILFLYLGYIEDYQDPLLKSIVRAKTYLHQVGYPARFIETVIGHIEYVRSGKIATDNIVRSIVSDVHYAYLGRKRCNRFLKSWWIESNINQQDKLGRYEWLKAKYNEFKEFEFRSTYARKKMEKRRKINLSKIKRKLLDLSESASLTNNKGALTMFKTALRNQVDLVNVADKKAAIMININAIILTLLLPLMASYIIDISRYILPTITLAITCGVTIIFATLATKPSKQKGALEDQTLKSGSKSLFFFGNFHEMSRTDYNQAVRGIITRKNVMESTIINHLFDLGRDLGRKYTLLRYTYTAFAIGIAITLICFAIMMTIPYDF